MAFTALLGACATEVDPELASPEAGASAAPTTEFVATGSTAELLDELLSEAGSLSEAIVDNDGQHVIVARIDVIWEAARPGVEVATEGDVASFERAIALLHRGVDRRHPADADKAYNNLRNLVAALPES